MERRHGILQLVSVLFSGLLAVPVLSDTQSCANLPVQVESTQPSTITDVCDGAASALKFLAPYGVKPTGRIVIDLVDATLERNGGRVFGYYDAGADRITLMSLSAIRAHKMVAALHGPPIGSVYYRSLVAHEVTHALYHQNSANEALSHAAQEYLAYVTQMAVLSPSYRQEVISHADVVAWRSGESISDIYMAMAPEKFAVKSYLHFRGLSDPAAFVKTLLNNKWFYVYIP